MCQTWTLTSTDKLREFPALLDRWQCGHKSLVQLGLAESKFKKYILSSWLNSITLRINLILSSGKDAQIFGKPDRGCRCVEHRRAKGILMSSLLRSSTWSWPALLILLEIQTSSNEEGRKPWVNFCINWTLKYSHKYFKGRMPQDLTQQVLRIFFSNFGLIFQYVSPLGPWIWDPKENFFCRYHKYRLFRCNPICPFSTQRGTYHKLFYFCDFWPDFFTQRTCKRLKTDPVQK